MPFGISNGVNLKESRENMSEKLLIVEDDKKLNDGIRLALKSDSKQGRHHISFIRCELAGWEWD